MKAYVFSIGEVTTKLCCEQLEYMGYEVVLWQDQTSLWEKLKRLYSETNEDFVRVDADIIPTANMKGFEKATSNGELGDAEDWWICTRGWDWYSQTIKPISIHYVKKQAIPYLRAFIDDQQYATRPETAMWRLGEFMNPRRCRVVDIVAGLHGYAQKDQRHRIKLLKDSRNQDYDWELVRKIEAL